MYRRRPFIPTNRNIGYGFGPLAAGLLGAGLGYLGGEILDGPEFGGYGGVGYGYPKPIGYSGYGLPGAGYGNPGVGYGYPSTGYGYPGIGGYGYPGNGPGMY